jgi:K+-sensing histidine kinase KdpD
MESIVRCIENGADDFMVKPFNVILLKARINACLEKKEQEDKKKKFNFWLAESYQKLQKAEQIRDEMFKMIVHDLNNSLFTILGSSELLMAETKLPENENIRKQIEIISKSGKEIQTLIASILDIAKMEQGNLTPEMRPVDIVSIVKDVGKQYEAVIKKRKGTLRITVSQKSIIHAIDEQLFRRILQNLLSNAVKYGMTGEKPLISISVVDEEDMLHVELADNGIGIPEDKTEKVFHKYYKLKPEDKGLGLGLTFCKMAMEVMGGTITTGKGSLGGASFSLTIS